MLDIAQTAVLFVDCQEGLVETSRTQPPAEIRRAAAALAELAGVLEMPCEAALVPFGPQAPPLIAELRGVVPEAHRRVRFTFGALDAEAAARLAAAGRRILVLAGVATEGAVLRTALEARAQGLAVRVLLDACGGLSTRTEDAAVRQMEAAGAVTTSLVSLATELPIDLGSETGRRAMGVLRGAVQPAA